MRELNLLQGTYRRDFDRGYLELREGWLHPEVYLNLIEELEYDLTQKTLTIYNKPTKLPRLTAWMGEGQYEYSGIVNKPAPWKPCTESIKDHIETQLGYSFNSVLFNFYRDGQDSISWHSDNEAGLGPTIASISTGGERKFRLRHKTTGEKIDLQLRDGSLLIMHDMQADWEHCVPKTSKHVEPRLNLTFRTVKVDE